MKLVCVASAIVCFCLPAASQGEVTAVAGPIKETRCSEPASSGLEMELKISGYEWGTAKALRLMVTQCVDDTGKALLDPTKENVYVQRWIDSGKNPSFKIKLLAASRRAHTIARFRATLEIVKPTADTSSTLRFPGFKEKIGQGAVTTPELAAVGIDLSLLTPTQFRAKDKKDAQGAMGKSRDNSSLFHSMFDASSDAIGPNDVICKFRDPDQRLGSIEFQDGSGDRIRDEGHFSNIYINWESTRSVETRTEIFRFTKALTDSAQMVIYLSTPRSAEKVEVDLGGIGLP